VGVAVKALAYTCARVALLIQHAAFRYIATCGLYGLPYFSILTHKRQDFWGKKAFENKICVLIFSTKFV
jgi:hypothetical protein